MCALHERGISIIEKKQSKISKNEDFLLINRFAICSGYSSNSLRECGYVWYAGNLKELFFSIDQASTLEVQRIFHLPLPLDSVHSVHPNCHDGRFVVRQRGKLSRSTPSELRLSNVSLFTGVEIPCLFVMLTSVTGGLRRGGASTSLFSHVPRKG